MKKSLKVLTSAAVFVTIIALAAGCGNTSSTAAGNSAAGSTAAKADDAAVSSTEAGSAAKEPTNTYVSENGMFSVELPGDWEEADNMEMSNFLMLSRKDGIQAMLFGMPKGQIFGPTGTDVNSLDGFMDYAESTFFNGPAMTTELMEAEGVAFPGTVDTISKEGTATQTNGAKAQVFIECVETDSSYYCLSFSFTKKYDETITSIKENLGFEELEMADADGLSDTLSWINASCAVIIKLNGGDLNTITGFEHNTAIQAGMQAMLTRDWDVNDQADLYETIDWLIGEGHNEDALQFLEDLGITGDSREDVLAELQADGTSEEEIVQIMAAYDAKLAYGDWAIRGWDYSRALSMLGWGYLADYLTYEDAMDKSLEIAQILQQNYDSWDDYMSSYFYGYSYWSGNDPEDTSSNAYKRHQIYEELKAEDHSIFSVDFKAELQKEW